ncbi:LysR family transcriptional regulator [Actinocrispum wychmicini]|uniref:DNA-binding transcriptional LysR family regulator n=1 Tax=Actinocrispum wychmicini TaxID=1213861 RepID=A0A4R2J8D7_9PSEU|nr:LysR family transcriptional regulator [Actinocrispum wychmicini]TCO52906.1 DNA-binding transcriptional LysR family regulator [Actinocrispum wychmicini]
MDLDTALLRAFVVTAEELHFGRAASRLVLSQQALSKRIARLEVLLGVELFERTNRRVTLSPAGERLVGPATAALSTLDIALGSAGAWPGPLTVDVLNEHLPPLRMVHQAIDRDPSLRLQVTMRKGDRDVVSDLRRGDFDLAFGRAGAITPWPADLSRTVLMLEPVGLLVSADDPLCARDEVTLAELRAISLWFPAVATPGEWVAYMDELGDRFQLAIDYTGSTMGFEFFVSRIASGVRRATFIGTAMALPPDTGLRVLRIADPVPVFPWWAIWPGRVPDTLVGRLLTGMVGGPVPPPAVPDPARIWLPANDYDYLVEDATSVRGGSVHRA